jgi:hypothetical protein
VAAFDGRLPGHTTGLGAMAVSEPPWHAHCSDASANGKGHVWRGRSHTCSIPCYIAPADPARRYWLIDREVSSAACYRVDVVMVGFSLYMMRAVLSGRGDEVIDLARTNLFR